MAAQKNLERLNKTIKQFYSIWYPASDILFQFLDYPNCEFSFKHYRNKAFMHFSFNPSQGKSDSWVEYRVSKFQYPASSIQLSEAKSRPETSGHPDKKNPDKMPG